MPTTSTSKAPILFLIGIALLFSNPFATANSNQHRIDSLQNIIDHQDQSVLDFATTSFHLANEYADLSKYSEAIRIYDSVLDIAKKEIDQNLLLDILGAKAAAYGMRGDRETSLKILYEGLALAEASNLLEKKADFLFLLGDYFRLEHQIEKAIDFLEKAEVIYKSINNIEKICDRVLPIKASSYKISSTKMGKLKAIESYKAILDGPCASTLSEYGRAKLLNNLGSTYIFVQEEEKAEQILSEALQLKRKLGIKTSLAFTLNEFATLREQQQRYDESVVFGKEAYELARQGENIFLVTDILETLFVATRDNKDFENAIQYFSLYNDIIDSVKNVEMTRSINELELKYKTAEREKAIVDANLELTIQENRFKIALLLFALLLFLALGIFYWYRDRLKRKNTETQVLEALNQSKTRYFTNISHELRTPLSLIIDPLDRLSAGINNPQQLTLVKTVANNAQRMLYLVNQMLDLEKLEAGKLKLNAKKENLTHLVKVIVDAFQTQASQKDIDLQFVSETDDLEVYVDNDKIEKILYNLLSNAFKFTPNGKSISVLLIQREAYIELIIKDTGLGIAKDKLPFIFDRFYQVDDSSTRQFDGTGIGLSLSKELIELHHGQLIAKSTLNEGTSMIVRLPLGRDHLQANEIQPSPIIAADNSEYRPNLIGDKLLMPNTSTKKTANQQSESEVPIILLVEDNEDLNLYLTQQLQAKYQILQATDGLAGWNQAIKTIPDLILSDIMMPKMDGYEFCKKLKQDERTAHIPVILLTAKSRLEEKIQGLKAQADDFLTKPFNSLELQTRIDNLIEQRQQLKLKYNRNHKISPKDITVNSIDEKFLERTLELIELNLSDDSFGVEELSKAIGMSRSQLYRKIKALTGQSTNSFVRSIRLKRAYQLLEQASGSASEIAFQVGFSNPSYFFKCFKEEFNITPGQLLKGEIINESDET